MRLDLISALEGSIPEQPPVDGAESGRGDEFPNVLRSTLDDAEPVQRSGTPDEGTATESASDVARAGAESERDSAAGEGSPGTGAQVSDSLSSPKPEKRAANGAGAELMPDEVTDAAELGVAASVLVNQARTGQSIESAIQSEGAISVLDAEGRKALGLPTASAGEPQRARAAGEAAERAASSPIEAGERMPGNPRDAKAVRKGASEDGTAAVRPGTDAPSVVESIGSRDSRADGEGPSDDRSDSRPQAYAETRAETRQAAEDAQKEQVLLDGAAEKARLEGVEAGVKIDEPHAEVSLRAPEVVPMAGVGHVANPVAGMVTEMTTTTTPGSPTPAAASDAIAVQTEWLASRGGGSARLLLNPPDLGEIAIRVTLREGAVDVVMVAHEAAARSVAEDQSDRLVHAFANRDLRMETFEVRRGDPTEIAGLDLSQFGDSGPHGRDRAEDETEGQGAPSRRGGAIGRRAGLGPVRSAQPEILSVGPESGVDLRI